MLARFIEGFGSRTADEWETALADPARRRGQVQHAGRVAGSRAGARRRARARGGRSGAGAGAVGRPGRADRGRVRRAAARPPARGGAGRARRPPHHRPLQLLGRSPGGPPAGRARGRRRQGGAARGRGCVPADAGAAQHLRRRQPVEAGPRLRPQDRRGPGPAARPRGRVRRRRRERDGGRVGAPRARRGAVACGQPVAGVRPGQGVRRERGRWRRGPPSTTSCRRRRGWR